MENKQDIDVLLKQREELSDQIRALDPMALIRYELKALSSPDEPPRLFSVDEVVDMITTFNLSSSYTTAKEAQQDTPNLFKARRAYVEEWITKFK